MLDVSSEEITGGPLLSALLALATPLLAQNLVQVVQQVIDVVFLGRYSSVAVSAVGLATPLVSLVVVAAVFAPYVGTQVVVAQRVGADDRRGARRALWNGLALALAIGGALGVVVFTSARPLVDLLTAIRPDPSAVVGPAAGYLAVTALGLPSVALSDVTEAAFVGHGDSRAALSLNLVALVTNAALDPVLIFGLGPVPEFGVAGAAAATALGWTVGFLAGAALLLRGRNDGMLPRRATGVDPAQLRALLDVGLPAAGQQIARQVIRLGVVVVAFAAGGAAALAAYVVGARVATVAFVPAQGLQQAAQSVVGQNLGAARPDRAARATWLGVGVAAGGLAVVGLAQWLVPGPLARLFAPSLDPAALDLTVEYLGVLAYGYPAIGALYLFEAGFNGAERTRVSFVATLVQYAAVRLPFAVVGALFLGHGVSAVFWAVTVSNVAAAVGLGAYYHRSVAGGMFRQASERAAAD